MIPDIYTGVKKLIDPLAMSSGRMTPKGVTIHHLADVKIERDIQHLVKEKLGYHFIIDRNGDVLQTCYTSHSVNHAGVADWNGLSPNRHHIAVSLSSWGAVTKSGDGFKAWNGTVVPASEVVRRKGNLNASDYYWHGATVAQEKSLMTLLRWCILNGIKPVDICGHDECALPSGRKSDPGGVLSVTMKDLRNALATKPGS